MIGLDASVKDAVRLATIGEVAGARPAGIPEMSSMTGRDVSVRFAARQEAKGMTGKGASAVSAAR